MNYVVRAGDTLNAIAARFGVSVQELIRVNNIPYPYYIYVGQNLYIPIAPTPAPGTDVERRLNRLENRVDALREDYRRLDNRVDRLENRVTRLERATSPRPTGTPRPR